MHRQRRDPATRASPNSCASSNRFCSNWLTNRPMRPSNPSTVCAITSRRPTCCSRCAPRRRASMPPASTAPDPTQGVHSMYVTHRLTLRALHAAVLAIATASASLYAHAASDDAMAPTDKQLNQLYWQGHEALQKGDWAAALKRFSDLEQQMRAKEPQNADAAVYWQAYTLQQAKRSTEGKAAVERLHRDFPKSRWSKDADALLRQGQAPAVAIKGAGTAGDDEELAEVAVEGLMSAPPERAIPLLKKVLQSQHSNKVKKRALFVLSQTDESAALDAVVDVAKTSNDPELREEAVRMLGVSGEERAIERL